MAKGKKTGGKDYKPGHQTPGPGRPTLPEDLKQARKLNQHEIERTLNQFLLMSPSELQKIKQNPDSTMLDLMIHSIVVNAVNKGDQQRLDFLLNRTIGKLKEKMELDVNPYLGKSLQELEALVRKKLHE